MESSEGKYSITEGIALFLVNAAFLELKCSLKSDRIYLALDNSPKPPGVF